MNTIREQDILDKSVLALEHLFGDRIQVENKPKPENSGIVDGYLEVASQKFMYAIKSNPSLSEIGR
ncbi:MAG: hypothetical protein AAFV07_10675, partial [Bacteroidota bacterium]